MTYYVDFVEGSDSNNGQTTAAAWKTIAQVNRAKLQPGDRILFKRGETWTGTSLAGTWLGTATNLIVFGAYGDGPRPIIDGNTVVDAITLENAEYVRFENIHATRGKEFGFRFGHCGHITLSDCEASHSGNDNIIFINGCHDCAVLDVVTHHAVQGGTGALVTGIEIIDGSHDFLVEGLESYNNAGAGLSLHAHSFGIGMPYNIMVKNCDLHDNGMFGINIFKDHPGPTTDLNIHFENCKARLTTNTNRESYGFGLYISQTKGDTPVVSGVTFTDCEFTMNDSFAARLRRGSDQCSSAACSLMAGCCAPMIAKA